MLKKSFICPVRCLRATIIGLLLLMASVAVLPAAVTIGRIENERLFGLQFPGGLAFYGVVNRISGVSIQEYISGPYLVTEMVIDLAASPSQLRIYVTEPYDPAELMSRAVEAGSGISSVQPPSGPAQKAAERARRTLSASTEDIVVKDYPVATHSKTIEYRLASRDNLMELFETFIHLWDGTGIDVVEGDEVESLAGLNGVRFIVSGE